MKYGQRIVQKLPYSLEHVKGKKMLNIIRINTSGEKYYCVTCV